jgi:predicted alpha-1,2-mannosidase
MLMIIKGNLNLLLKYFLILEIFLLSFHICAQKTHFVDGFVGVNNGNILVGSSLPFSLMRLSPDVEDNRSTNGYNSNKKIIGFSHTHTSGTGGPSRYGNFRVTPLVGPYTLDFTKDQYKIDEYAKPGYYRVELMNSYGSVLTELTSTTHVGLQRFTYFKKKGQTNFSLYLDVASTVKRSVGNGDAYCDTMMAEVISPNEIQGFGQYSGGWGGKNPYKIYFYAITSKEFSDVGSWKNGVVSNNKKTIQGKDGGLILFFDETQRRGHLLLKLSVSLISMEKAKENAKQVNEWDFDYVRLQADSVWNSYLSKIDIKGGTPEQRVMFYTALRNTAIMPTDITGENPEWKTSQPSFWDFYCIWDVFRTTFPLYTLIDVNHQSRIVNSLLDIYKHKGWLPDAWISGHYAAVQGGSNADVVLADALLKGVPGIDTALALEAMLKNATVPSDLPLKYGRFLNDYNKYGYVTSSTYNGASSRTLEYCYNDYCIAQVAEMMGKKDLAEKYYAKSMNSFSLFHPEHKMFWAKDSTGAWMPNFTKHSLLKDFWNDPYFYEGGAEIYSTYVPHAMPELVMRHGGYEAFSNFLDTIFETNVFKLENEPLFLVPYLYNVAGRPDKTAERVRDIMRKDFQPTHNGYPGDDDSGAMSAWYVFSAMGFFPVAGQDLYLIGSPVFDEVNIDMGNGKQFIIRANNNSHHNIYIAKATLNGKELTNFWFRHSDIKNGAILELEMTNIPNYLGRESHMTSKFLGEL